MEKWYTDSVDKFFEAILTLKTKEECKQFFEDVCTVKEIQAISQRLEVAVMLSEKKVYNAIVQKTGASTATISRVNRCLKYSSDGYLKVLDDIEKREKRRNLYDGV